METDGQQRAKWVARWKDSGLTAKEFATEAGLNASTLYNWSAQLSAAARKHSAHRGETAAQSLLCATPSPHIIELPVAAVASTTAIIELLLGEVRVRVPPGVDEETLTRVLRALAGAQ
jgi:transposase-like protein